LKAAGDYTACKGFQYYTLSNKAILFCAGKGEDVIISIQGPDDWQDVLDMIKHWGKEEKKSLT
jgi:hypothetical protein